MERKQYIHSSKINAVCKTVSAVMAAFAIFASTSLTSCVKDELFDTPHPDHGKVTVTTDWSGRGEGIAVPGMWVVNIGEYTGEETAEAHAPDFLFEPDEYRMTVYSPAEDITVSGTVATVAVSEGFVSDAPGWLFSHVQDIVIEKDRDHTFTAQMKQQVRRLTLVIEPTGDAKDRIGSIEGTLSGVAGTLDIATDEHGTPSDVKLNFAKITEGDDAGKWAATVKLLGTAGDVQKFVGTITFRDGNPQPMSLESDLAANLKDFNTKKTEPLVLTGNLNTPMEAGMSATIENWQPGNGGGEDVDIQ